MFDSCCAHIKRGASPFGRVLVLGWHDGITSALVQCGDCGRSYSATLVAWDAEQEFRIMELRQIDTSKFDDVLAAHAKFDEPRWPVWYPRYPDQDTLESTVRLVERARSSGWLASCFLSTRDISKEILGIRALSFEDWNALLARTQ